MNTASLQAAIAEARRFTDRAEDLLDAMNIDPVLRVSGIGTPIDGHPREQGAVRRASMDLTRALADLRRPG